MQIADRKTYLADIVEQLKKHWPENRTINIVCHGHSVPAGYFATPMVDTFNAYPHLLHSGLKERFPFSVVNVIVTAIGGESSLRGSVRFKKDVLGFNPNIVLFDYGLNDRGLGLEKAKDCWIKMVDMSLDSGAKVILLTPTMDIPGHYGLIEKEWDNLELHAEQIRKIAGQFHIGLVDSYLAFENYIKNYGELTDLLSWVNHPNRKGHEIVAKELLSWFPVMSY